jgi:tetratricopeptide (TPR) repeat protein
MRIGQALIAGRYLLMEAIGQGGMGMVHRALDKLTNQVVALKRVRVFQGMDEQGSLDVRLAMAQEFRLMATLRHPNIVSVLDYGFDLDGHPFFTMELIEGATDVLTAARDLSLRQKVNLLIQALLALSYLHRRGVVHRDLKPENLLVVGEHLRLVDFGISAAQGFSDVSAEGMVSGTLAYLAPELLRGQDPIPASDLYALGIILFQVLTHRHPHPTLEPTQLIYDILNTEPDLRPLRLLAEHLKGDDQTALLVLREALTRLLAKRPEHRYQTAREVAEVFAAAVGEAVPDDRAEYRESYLVSARFVGREEYLSVLRSALEQAEDGRGSVWLVGGESGVGKSRLLDELRAQALVRGTLVLRGQSVADNALPYQLWRDPARRLVLTSRLTELEAGVMKALVPDVSALLGRDIPDAPQLDGPQTRQRLGQTLLDALRLQHRVILLLLEDLQWAAEGVELLKDIALAVQDLPILVVGTYRDDERPDLPSEVPSAQTMKLRRFSHQTIQMLSLAMLGEAGQRPEVVQFLERETEGNVFFVIEVLRALAETAGGLNAIATHGLPETVVAGGVRDVLMRRLRRLPDETLGLLKRAAVAGRMIDLALLPVWAGEAFDVTAWLTTCNNAAVLELVDGVWRFSHDKLREAVLDDVPSYERPGLHREVAQAIERVYPNDAARAAALAEHWRMAGDPMRYLKYGLEGARQVRAVGRFDECQRMCHLLLELLDKPDERRMEVLTLLGDAYWDGNQYADAEKAYKESLGIARRLRHTLGAAAALIGLGSVNWRTGKLEEAEQYYGEGQALAERVDSVDYMSDALNGLGVVTFDRGDFETSRRHLERALAFSKRSTETWREARCYNNLANTLNYQGDAETAKAYCRRAYDLYRELGDRRSAAYTALNLGAVLESLRDYAAAQIYYEEGMTIFKMLGNPSGLAAATSNLGSMLEIRGELTPALSYHLEALEIAQRLGDPYLECAIRCNAANAALSLNDIEQARSLLAELLMMTHERGLRPLELEALAVYARLLMLTSKPEEAAELAGVLTVHLHRAAVEARLNPLLDALSAMLDLDAFAAAHERGKGMEVEIALVRALRDLRQYTRARR